MNKRSGRFRTRQILMRTIPALLASVIAVSTFLIWFLKTRDSAAYLYDEYNLSVDYSVAQLAFDLSSNHMYKYYTDNPSYTHTFEPMLLQLKGLTDSLNAAEISITEFDASVKTALAAYYSEELINALQTAWDENNSSQEAYDEAAGAIYNAHYRQYEFLFKIKNMQLQSVDSTKSIWYYYADDLLRTYYDEYVVQSDASGVRQSTMRVGVKLKGGTTYSADASGNYYDTYFNDMVTAFTMDFKNSGNVSLYLKLDMNMFPTSNRNKGILGMVLPYGMTWETLKTGIYESYYDTVTGKWDYRGLIGALLENKEGGFLSTVSGTMPDDIYTSLTYDSMQALLEEWNAYAINTYNDKDTDYVNANGSIVVVSDDNTQEDAIHNVRISMVFWSDYEKSAAFYASQSGGKEWRSDDAYQLIRYDFAIDAKTSLKNSDMSLYTPADWAEMYNEEKVYEKFAGVSNFDIEGYAYFEKTDGGTTTVVNAKNYMQGGYIICNYVDETAVNYIANLRFDVLYRGYSPAFIRVRLIEQFTNTAGEIEAVNRLKFALGENWADNRAQDLYFYSNKQYFSSDNAMLTTLGKAKMLTIPVITGLSSEYSQIGDIDPLLTKDKTMKLKMTFFAEAVQPNRTEEYWYMSAGDINAMFP